jgi:lipopolysaccharide/colanic/teichoic acid biosynthesis glycosyltransferase
MSKTALLLTMKPGITGYWQVSGRQEVSYEARAKMNVHYIQNRSSFCLPDSVLDRGEVLKRQGAY